MEPEIFENSCSTPFQPPEDFLTPAAYRFLPAANDHQTLLITDSDQTIELAFSRLNLTSDVRFRSQETSFHGHPAALSGVAPSLSIPPPMAFEGSQQQQQALNWAQSSSINGPLGARQNINVGPDSSGRGPYAHNQFINYYQRQDFYDANNCDGFDYHSLHGKESLPRNARYNVPVVPFVRKNNSFTNSLYADQQLYKLAQHLTPENMIGKIVSLAKNQVWSSALILKLEVGLSEGEIEMIVLEVMEFWDDLLRNQFGSQFVQKLFSVCDEDQRTRIIMALTKLPFKITSICLNPSGAKSVQKLLEKLNTPQQISLVVASLIPGAFVLATDCNGQHIIHYCVKRFPGEYTTHLLNEIAENCFRIATYKSGCCVIQSCVENSRGETRDRLIMEIIENAVQLAEDPYGNYVVQHLLGMKMHKVTKYLLRRFQGCFVSLSCNKYASNVVEKLLELGEEVSATIIMELLRNPDASMLLVDPFGNFVIQKALSAAKGKVYNSLVKLIQVNAASMQSNLYGKKILAWFDKKKPYNA